MRGDDAVGPRTLPDEIDGDLFGGETGHAVEMDDGKFIGRADAVDDRGDRADVAKEREDHAHIGRQAGVQPRLVAHGRDDWAILQSVVKALFHGRTSNKNEHRNKTAGRPGNKCFSEIFIDRSLNFENGRRDL